MFKKITMAQARELYAEHKDFIIVPRNLPPDHFMALNVDCHSFEHMIDEPFDDIVWYFRYYNCSVETGLRPAFYIKVN